MSESFRHAGEDSSGCVGRYTRAEHVIDVDMRSGVGDVVATAQGVRVVAECKGGFINTRHSGQLSRLRKGLCKR